MDFFNTGVEVSEGIALLYWVQKSLWYECTVCIAPLPKIHFTVSILSLSRQIFFDQNLLNQSICRIRSTTILWEIERLASNQLVTEKNKYINKIEEFK